MKGFVYLWTAILVIVFNALTLAYIANQYYALGVLAGKDQAWQNWAQGPVGTCFATKGDC